MEKTGNAHYTESTGNAHYMEEGWVTVPLNNVDFKLIELPKELFDDVYQSLFCMHMSSAPTVSPRDLSYTDKCTGNTAWRAFV